MRVPRVYPIWTYEDRAAALAMRKEQKKSWQEIAAHFGRSMMSCKEAITPYQMELARQRLERDAGKKPVNGVKREIKPASLRWQKPIAERCDDAKPRKCLGCGEIFPSSWRGNRMCERCR
jgi:transposase-like protein